MVRHIYRCTLSESSNWPCDRFNTNQFMSCLTAFMLSNNKPDYLHDTLCASQSFYLSSTCDVPKCVSHLQMCVFRYKAPFNGNTLLRNVASVFSRLTPSAVCPSYLCLFISVADSTVPCIEISFSCNTVWLCPVRCWWGFGFVPVIRDWLYVINVNEPAARDYI